MPRKVTKPSNKLPKKINAYFRMPRSVDEYDPSRWVPERDPEEIRAYYGRKKIIKTKSIHFLVDDEMMTWCMTQEGQSASQYVRSLIYRDMLFKKYEYENKVCIPRDPEMPYGWQLHLTDEAYPKLSLRYKKWLEKYGIVSQTQKQIDELTQNYK